jgi:hypothetical protein
MHKKFRRSRTGQRPGRLVRSGQVKTEVAAGGHGNAWHVINDLITIKGRVFVQRDSTFLADILRHVHETSHEGTEKTWH